jgi:hypothetical protein
MAKKIKTEESRSTEEIIKKIKTSFLNVIVKDWLNTKVQEWGGLSPLDMIKNKKGQQILDAIKKIEDEIKSEKNSKKECINVIGNREENDSEQRIFSGI